MLTELPQTYFRAIEKISRLLTEGEEFKTTMYSILVRLDRQTGMKRGMIIEAVHLGKATSLGVVSGILAGLVVITPASGMDYSLHGENGYGLINLN